MGNIFENPWPTILLLLFIAFASAWLWYRFRHWLPMLFGGVAMLLALVTLVVSVIVVTEREELRRFVGTLARAISANDVEGVLQHFADDSPEFRGYVQRDMENVDFVGCWIVSIDYTEFDEDPRKAKMQLKVFCDVTRSPYGPGRNLVLLWLDFRRGPDEQWRIISYRYDLQ